MIEAALSLLGDTWSNTETHNAYWDYVKIWTTASDYEELKYVSDVIYQFSKTLQLITYNLLIKETSSECAFNDETFFGTWLCLILMLLCLVNYWGISSHCALQWEDFQSPVNYFKNIKEYCKRKKGLCKELH